MGTLAADDPSAGSRCMAAHDLLVGKWVVVETTSKVSGRSTLNEGAVALGASPLGALRLTAVFAAPELLIGPCPVLRIFRFDGSQGLVLPFDNGAWLWQLNPSTSRLHDKSAGALTVVGGGR